MTNTESSLLMGVDVGGTFTDVFALNLKNGVVTTAKVPSTPADQSQGFVAGLAQCTEDFATISAVVHGTTVGTNALLERKVACTGIITTRGFADVLEMRRRDRPTTWGLKGSFTPVVDRTCRLEVDERVLADGSVLQAVDDNEVERRARELLAVGCDAVCVFFINGYANASNEKAAVERVRQIWPNEYVTAATEILPEIREFERLSTATLNASLMPLVSKYLDRLQQGLQQRQCDAEVLIVQSSGGVMTLPAARQFPVRTALSGPAAGVIAAIAIASAAGYKNLITCDMGGTSFDVSLVANGKVSQSAQTAIDFGMVVRTPMVEIVTIGAGGGSIARIDAGGLLQVGPESAGSDPGPVCYARGNTKPTVTDANLVLGRINPVRPLGDGLASLDVNAARTAIEKHIAAPLALSIEQAAEAILTLANAHMAGAIRLVSIERGHDPADFVAVPFGGGGALHTGALIRHIGISAALVPRFPGVTSALGCVIADMRHDHVQTVNRLLVDINTDELQQRMNDALQLCESHLQGTQQRFESIERLIALDMLYLGQTHSVSVPLSAEAVLSHDSIQSAFDHRYQASYGQLLEKVPVRVINFRVTAVGRRAAMDMSVFRPAATDPGEPLATRQVFANGEFCQATVYDRLALPVAARITGPALLEQHDATVFVDPGLQATVDNFGNLLIREV